MRHFEFFKVPFSVLGDTIGVPVEFKFRAELKNDVITGMIVFGTYNLPIWSNFIIIFFLRIQKYLFLSIQLRPFGFRYLLFYGMLNNLLYVSLFLCFYLHNRQLGPLVLENNSLLICIKHFLYYQFFSPSLWSIGVRLIYKNWGLFNTS